ncbi:MAG: VWA domain-containing protein [Planctomycetes bacterium]|nr:VWA domain-containing protein [Planctomycetota bacterium]
MFRRRASNPTEGSDEPLATADENVEQEAYAADSAEAAEEPIEYEYVEGRRLFSRLFYSFGSCGISLIAHCAGLLVMAFLTLPEPITNLDTLVEAVFESAIEDPPVEFELDPDVQVVTDPTTAMVSSAPMVGVGVGVNSTAGPPTLDQEVMKAVATDANASDINIDHPLANAPSFRELTESIPEGQFKGEARAVVDDYQQAMDRIAQELLLMMDAGPVLLIWVFDESGSMKDDQAEIRERINGVYLQLGLVGRDKSRWLETSIISYGKDFHVHTKLPTSDINQIRQAIDSIPEDASGLEMMCQAVGFAIAGHREYAKRTRRQMALILVTDESGEQENNWGYLEPAIAEAQAVKSRVYVLGRESVFGYPYVYMRWVHPQTHRPHWISVNRGPETAFVEQLQIDGFRRRYDAFPSGFGPYEQCRMARETGGIFFMLPSLESALVRGEKRRYELEIMRPYRPDLRHREELLGYRETYPLRAVIWKCIYDLNPYNKDIAAQIEMRVHFSIQYPEFVKQARIEQAKATKFIVYLAAVQKVMEGGAMHREQEADPRWQANYDLIYAQIVAYQARIWEYGASLEEFIKNPKTAPLTKSPNLRLVHWDVTTRAQILTEESKPYIERATELFNVVVANHPGTPWAARAQRELKRGFGVDFRPDYDPPYLKPTGKVIPVPKL